MDNIRDNRVHKLLGILLKEFPADNGTTSIRYDWTFEDLATEYKNTNIHKIGELCRQLAVDMLVEPHADRVTFDSDQLRYLRQAYHSGKFKEKRNWGNIINIVLGILNIGLLAYSTINTDKLDDKIDTLTKTVESQTKNLEKKQVTLDSLKGENISIQKSIDSLIKELKVKKISTNNKDLTKK